MGDVVLISNWKNDEDATEQYHHPVVKDPCKHHTSLQPSLVSDTNDWLLERLKKKLEATRSQKKREQGPVMSAMPKQLPTNENEYTEVFQTFIADGLSLNQDIASAMLATKGVESVGIGFSTVREGYWPVIRVSPDEETWKRIKKEKSSSFLHDEITNALQKILGKLYSHTCSKEQLDSMVEVIETNYPLKTSELCTAGGQVITRYPPHIPETGTATCSIHNKLEVGGDVYVSHYAITPFHVVIPAKSEEFAKELPLIPVGEVACVGPEKHTKYKRIYNNVSEAIQAVGIHTPNLVPLLIQASVFPQHSHGALEMMKRRFAYQCSVKKHGQEEKIDFIVGKTGLFHMYDDSKNGYNLHIFFENSAPANKHPCNVDIAVLQQGEHYLCGCSIEDSFPNLTSTDYNLPSVANISWFGPPECDIKHRKGNVVVIKQGEIVQKLSDKLELLHEAETKDGKYPHLTWKAGDQQIYPGDSGSPVFLKMDDSFYLIGGLMTRQHAFPIDFSLKLIKYEVAIHHTQQVIEKIEKSQEMPDAEKIKVIGCLNNYKTCLEHLKDEQSLEEMPHLTFSELTHETVVDDRIIKSEMNICVNSP